MFHEPAVERATEGRVNSMGRTGPAGTVIAANRWSDVTGNGSGDRSVERSRTCTGGAGSTPSSAYASRAGGAFPPRHATCLADVLHGARTRGKARGNERVRDERQSR